MASTLVDLVKINITSNGTGPLTLGTAVQGYRGREALTNGRVYSYSIQQGNNWEIGRGTFLSATKQLVRTVLFSSNGGTAIALKGGGQVSFSLLSQDLSAVQLTADALAAATQTQADAEATASDRAAVEAIAAASGLTYDAASSAAAAAASATDALQAVTAAQGFCNTLSASAAALPREVTAISGGIGTGTGGTPGTYAGGVSGGPAGFKWSYTIGSDGKLASYRIENPGIATSNTAPTLSFPSGGMTSPTIPTATVSTIPVNRVFLAPTSTGTDLLAWINNAGSLSQYPTSGAQFSLPASSGLAALRSAATTYAALSYTVVAGSYCDRTTGVITASASYQYLIYNVGSEIGFRASGTLGGGVVAALAVYFSGANGTGTVLGFQVGANSSDNVNVALNLPNGTQSIVISSTISGIPIKLEQAVYANGDVLTSQGNAAFRAQSRSALQSVISVAADYGSIAQVFGYATSGDVRPHRYIRGGGCFPTSNGWGIDPTETSLPALAFGIASPRDDTVDSTNALDIYRTPTLARAQEDTNDTIVTMPSSGLYNVKGIDADKLHFVDLGAGATLEVNVAHLPYAKTYSFSSMYEANTGRIVFDAGFGNTFLDTGTRFLSCSAGTKIQIQRRSYSQFLIVSWSQFGGNAAPTGIAQGSYSPVVRATSAFAAGQSLAQQGYFFGSSHGAFINRLAELTGPSSVHMVNAAYGGSGICERDCDPTTPTNYWVDMTNPASPADGPNLTAAMAIIASKNGDSSQPAYGFGIIDHGQQSSAFVDSPLAPNANFTKAMYKTATQYMISRLRTAAGSSTLKIGIRPIGRRTAFASTNAGRMQVIRDAQLEIVAADANLFLAAETYDVELRDPVHPTETGYDIIGYRDADEVAKAVYGKTGMFSHPAIFSATLNTTFNYVDVVIRTGNYSGGNIDRIFLVPDPRGFAVFSSGGVQRSVVKAIWTATDTSNPSYQQATLRLFLDGAASGGTLYYVYDLFAGFDPQRPIRLSQASQGKALRTAKVTL